MTWQIYTLIAVLLFAVLSLLQRVLAVESKSQRAMAVAFNSVAALFAVIFFLFSNSIKNFELPKGIYPYIVLLLATFFYAMFERGRFQAAKLLDASIMTTISNIAVPISVIGAVFLYSETFSAKKILGTALIFIALLIVSYTKGSSTVSKKGILISVVIHTMLGLGMMLDKLGTQLFNPETYNILVWTLPLIMIYLPYVSFKEIKYEFKSSAWKIYLLAFINVAGYYMQLKALQAAEATRVLPILQTSTLLTILLGVFILNERDRLATKIVAGIIAVGGTIFLI